MKEVTFNVAVDHNGNATVTRSDGSTEGLTKDVDRVRFSFSGDPGLRKIAAVKFIGTSAFGRPRVGEVISFDDANKGPFTCVNRGVHHFDCGGLLPPNGTFSKWGGSNGGDIPVC
jgi:hypothetical protein